MKNNSDEDYKKGLEEFNLYMKKYHKKIIMKIKFFEIIDKLKSL
jgi:hypothetical protein